MTCSRGDVVLVGFVFSEENGKKLRPAVVVSSAAYHRGRKDVIVAAITSNTRRHLFGDQSIADWKSAGLLMPSVATGIIRTIKAEMIERKLGSLRSGDLQRVSEALRGSLSV